MCFSQAAQSSKPYGAAKSIGLAGALMGRAMGNSSANGFIQKYKQDFQTNHGGMTAAQVVGQRGQV